MSDQEPVMTKETEASAGEEAPALASVEPMVSFAESETLSEPPQDIDALSPPQVTETVIETKEETPAEEAIPRSDESGQGKANGLSIHTLKPGQHIEGKVKNITRFGAFVDIGLPQDGLVHISNLSRQKVENVVDAVSEGQTVDVWVKKVDKKRGRISLTMIKPIKLKLRRIEEGTELEGTVTRLESYGAFIDIGSDRDGLVHISQITHDYIKHAQEALAVGDKVNVKVLKVNRKKRQVDLSIKALLPLPEPPEEEIRKIEAAQKAKPAKQTREKAEAEAEESAPTAMALAYAAFRDEKESDSQVPQEASKLTKSRRKREMDAIIARTLATREE